MIAATKKQRLDEGPRQKLGWVAHRKVLAMLSGLDDQNERG